MLTARSAVWINLFAVEIAFPVAVLMVRSADPAFALVAVWPALVNGVVNRGSFVRPPRYNPGVASAVVRFLPLGGFVGLAVSAQQVTALGADLLALLAAIAVVAAIAAAAWGTRKPIRVNGGRLGQRPECGIASAK